MTVHSDLLLGSADDLAALRATIQESKRQALAADFSSPDLEANIRRQVDALDQSFETIDIRAVIYELTTIVDGFPPDITVDTFLIEPAELLEGDVEDAVSTVTIRNSKVWLFLARTVEELVDLG